MKFRVIICGVQIIYGTVVKIKMKFRVFGKKKKRFSNFNSYFNLNYSFATLFSFCFLFSKVCTRNN